MNDLLVFAAHNTVAALLLALFVALLTRLWRNPPVAHVLWLLVLVRLVVPPVMGIDWPVLRPSASAAAAAGRQSAAETPAAKGLMAPSQPLVVDRPVAGTAAERAVTPVHESRGKTGIGRFWDRGQPVLLCFWIGGAAVCALVAVKRIVQFEYLLRDTLPASERLQRLASEIAGRLGVRRVPRVRYAGCVDVPLVWCAGRRPTIVLPMPLFRRLDDESAALILAHELAHLRRRDHWVRAFDLFVSTIYWWNPLVWLIRRQIHECEDVCCDAWVRWLYPGARKRYAEVMLETAESLTSHVAARLLPASPFLRSLSLKARIEMILESRFAPRLSLKAMFLIAPLAFVVLPSFVATKGVQATAATNDDAEATPAQKPDARPDSEFPCAVAFEQGATRFLDGDKITILEVRGTADTFAPSNIYWIKGTYTLASHQRATLAAYITASDAAHGTSTSFKAQTTVVNRGDGTFTLFLPMSYEGWPHISFYPAEGGSDFGGNYFGTGNFVLKKWWGSREPSTRSAPKSKTTRKQPGTSDTDADIQITWLFGNVSLRQEPAEEGSEARTARNMGTQPPAEFPHLVSFEQGATRFLDGDKITILEIRGTAPTFAPNNFYQIKGSYTLASHDGAMLAAYTTAMDAKDGTGPTLKIQSTVVGRGDGTFTLILPMSCRGWPHLSFYPADGGNGFGGNYFGTGDSVLKRWWGSKDASAQKP